MNTGKSLWRCERCGREFANRNQWHSCGRYTLAHHFRDRPPEIRRLFDAVVAAIEEIGPVRMLPEKTRIAFQVRMSFAQVTPRRAWLDGHVVLARRLEQPRFRDIQTFSPRNHVHCFRLESVDEIDDDFRTWLAEAYRVGAQEHLRSRKKKARVEDALHATRAAVEEGVVAGGGVALVRTQSALDKVHASPEAGNPWPDIRSEFRRELE